MALALSWTGLRIGRLVVVVLVLSGWVGGLGWSLVGALGPVGVFGLVWLPACGSGASGLQCSFGEPPGLTVGWSVWSQVFFW